MNETTRISTIELHHLRLHGEPFMTRLKEAISTPELDAEAALRLLQRWVWAMKLSMHGEGETFASIPNITKGIEIAREVNRVYRLKFLMASFYPAMIDQSTLPQTNRNMGEILAHCWGKYSQELLESVLDRCHPDMLLGVYLLREIIAKD